MNRAELSSGTASTSRRVAAARARVGSRTRWNQRERGYQIALGLVAAAGGLFTIVAHKRRLSAASVDLHELLGASPDHFLVLRVVPAAVRPNTFARCRLRAGRGSQGGAALTWAAAPSSRHTPVTIRYAAWRLSRLPTTGNGSLPSDPTTRSPAPQPRGPFSSRDQGGGPTGLLGAAPALARLPPGGRRGSASRLERRGTLDEVSCADKLLRPQPAGYLVGSRSPGGQARRTPGRGLRQRGRAG